MNGNTSVPHDYFASSTLLWRVYDAPEGLATMPVRDSPEPEAAVIATIEPRSLFWTDGTFL
eukprot:1095854-Alexandrium_andersonii.AAC.1